MYKKCNYNNLNDILINETWTDLYGMNANTFFDIPIDEIIRALNCSTIIKTYKN